MKDKPIHRTRVINRIKSNPLSSITIHNRTTNIIYRDSNIYIKQLESNIGQQEQSTTQTKISNPQNILLHLQNKC